MDCSITKNYLEEKARMTRFNPNIRECGIDCLDCIFSGIIPGGYCDAAEMIYPEKCIRIVQEWSDANPRKTYLQDFLEKFPGVDSNYITDTICVQELYHNETVNCDGYISCKNCWKLPLGERK